MKIILNDINKRIIGNINKEELSNMLLQLGHEHEIDNNIIDFELTPNRGDCFSLLGLLRDLNSLIETDINFKTYEGKFDELNIDFENNAPLSCPNITFAEIEIDEIPKDYSEQLEGYLERFDQKKINFFTDISNYVSYETGQPTHCYDSKFVNYEIKLERSINSNEFNTLTGKKIKLADSNLIFTNKNEVINLAGVMGGSKTACSQNTKKVLIECAYFVPKDILGANIKYDLNSDAAHKFERGVDPLCHDYTIRRFIQIIKENTEVKSIKLKKFENKKFKRHKIKYCLDTINKVIGINIGNSEYLKYLNNLGFEIKNEEIYVPSYRHDIRNNNDLAEEIARVIGYDNIKRKQIKIPNNPSDKINNHDNIRNYMIDFGFYEVINFPFTEEERINSISIDNPLDSNKSSMRTNLKMSLKNNLAYNERRQKDSIKLFEISDVYSFDKQLNKQTKIGIIASGRLGNNYRDFSKNIDKKYFENLLSSFKEHFISDVPDNIIEISRDEINSKMKNKIFYTEFVINDASSFNYSNKKIKNNKFIKYEKISDFPSTSRDLSFAVGEPEKYYELADILLNYKTKNLKDIFIFDFFHNKDKDILKIGFRFTFQSINNTLSDKDVDKLMNDIIDISLNVESVSIPGLN